MNEELLKARIAIAIGNIMADGQIENNELQAAHSTIDKDFADIDEATVSSIWAAEIDSFGNALKNGSIDDYLSKACEVIKANDKAGSVMVDLVLISAGDGDMADDEFQYAYKIAEMLGYSEEEFLHILLLAFETALGKDENYYACRQPLARALFAIAIGAVCADGKVEDDELQAAYLVVAADALIEDVPHVVLKQIWDTEVQKFIKTEDMEKYLKDAADFLVKVDQTKEALKKVTFVIASDGELADEEVGYLCKVGELMGKTDDEVVSIAKEAIQEIVGNKSSASSSTKKSGGCYVATCVYGSYDCPEVWTLRRFRDNTLAATWYGRLFIKTYYAVSPTLVKWFGHTEWFKNMWKPTLERMVKDLQSKGVEDTPYDDKMWR